MICVLVGKVAFKDRLVVYILYRPVAVGRNPAWQWSLQLKFKNLDIENIKNNVIV